MASLEIKNKDLTALLEKDGPFPAEFAQRGSVPVMSVDHVQISEEIFGGTAHYIITAIGKVPTTGWTQPHLQPYIYIQPPPDGIWDFVFLARPPAGPAGDVVLPIAATFAWKRGSYQLKGVRVHSAHNSITVKIGKGTHAAA
jgi:hypothetical protein